jgi:hypothetical protein
MRSLEIFLNSMLSNLVLDLERGTKIRDDNWFFGSINKHFKIGNDKKLVVY